MARASARPFSVSVAAGLPLGENVYRCTNRQLFADVRADVATIPEGDPLNPSYYLVPAKAATPAPTEDYLLGTVGPSYLYVETKTAWAWQHPGGDWVNKAGAAQGTSEPHFSIAANQVTSGAATYAAAITEGVAQALARGRWNAYIVQLSGAMRAIASQRNQALTPPRIDVDYADGTSGQLACTACVQLVSGTSYTRVGSTTDAAIDSAVALEFEMPAKAVAAATLTLTVTRHTASAATLNGYLANPPANSNPLVPGVAASHPADRGLRTEPSILFAQRYEDGTTLADYVIPDFPAIDVWSLDNWDPELFGTGPANLAKLPTAHQGVAIAGTHKWFHKQPLQETISLVSSAYTGDGFVPAEPGLGALRIVIPKGTSADGAAVGYGGSTGSDLWALFPKQLCGLIRETFVRFRIRFAATPKALAATKAFRSAEGMAAGYAIREGKWGVGTHHWTKYGGNNNWGGDNYGHTNRLGFRVHPSDLGVLGIESFVHSWDMIKEDMPFGNDGGLGAGFYPNRWYWIEIRKRLNTYDPVTGVGTADGLMEIFVDGRLAARHTGWRYRNLKLDYLVETPIADGFLVPFREMGDSGLLLNLYNGGVHPADEDNVMFFAQVACGTTYIGPS